MKKGFTIVELLIVIVVIGILAVVAIVAYTGVQARATVATIQSDLTQASKQLDSYKFSTSASEKYPSDLSTLNLQASVGTTYQYAYNSITNLYCLSAQNGTSSNYITSLDTRPRTGTCATIEGLVGWWTFNGNTNDSSGQGNKGTNGGATLTTGQKGQASSAYAMDGGGIAIGSPSIFNNLSATGFTYSLWIMKTATSTGRWPVIMGTNTHLYYGIRSQNYGDDIGVEYAKTPYDNATYSNFGGAGINVVNTWHLATFTYDGTTMTYYWDGVSRGTSSFILNPVNGGISFGSWAGSIDDARVYNRALSAGDVSSLFAAGAL